MVVLLDRFGVCARDEVVERVLLDDAAAVVLLEDLARDFARAEARDLGALDEMCGTPASLRLSSSSGEIGISSSTCVGSSCFSVVADTIAGFSGATSGCGLATAIATGAEDEI